VVVRQTSYSPRKIGCAAPFLTWGFVCSNGGSELPKHQRGDRAEADGTTDAAAAAAAATGKDSGDGSPDSGRAEGGEREREERKTANKGTKGKAAATGGGFFPYIEGMRGRASCGDASE